MCGRFFIKDNDIHRAILDTFALSDDSSSAANHTTANRPTHTPTSPASEPQQQALEITQQTQPTDVCPGQTVSVITAKHTTTSSNEPTALRVRWGIKPGWSSRTIINARAETVTEKPTFRLAFSNNRCVVPISGWYEWQQSETKKQRYRFSEPTDQPLWMAAIYYLHAPVPELVTLTTTPTRECAAIHDRMPLLIAPQDLDGWLFGDPEVASTALDKKAPNTCYFIHPE